jgi:hypothetical protein
MHGSVNIKFKKIDYLIKSRIYGHLCVENVSKLGVNKRKEFWPVSVSGIFKSSSKSVLQISPREWQL